MSWVQQTSGTSDPAWTCSAGNMVGETSSRASPEIRQQAITSHSHLTMQTPTTAQLRTAIEVLKKLGERLNTHAENSAMQLAESPVTAHQAAQIGVGAIEQTTRIEGVVTQLEQWRTELNQQRRQCVTHHV